MKRVSRRNFIKKAAAFGAGIYFMPSLGFPKAKPKKKVITLGIDGMDPRLASQFMRLGALPNLQKLARRGSLLPLQTTYPPQSPVAWASFTVGGPPSRHGIYDFIHRDRKTRLPYHSTSKAHEPDSKLKIGEWEIPMGAGSVENFRQGKPFWDYLAENDVPTTVFKMPANFPCYHEKVDMVSGMGTPDLRGGYGTYTLYTTAPYQFPRAGSGGKLMGVFFQGGKVQTTLPGPADPMRVGHPEIEVPLTIWRDSANPVVRVLIDGQNYLLKENELSDWIPVSFPYLAGGSSIKGMFKIYLKSVHPHFSMYITPINADPQDTDFPVFSNDRYKNQLVREIGRFHTQGLPYDSKALSEGVLTDDEFYLLSQSIFDERKRLLDFELRRFKSIDRGVLFFYVNYLDQSSHMFWRFIDKKSRAYRPELQKKYGHLLQEVYSKADQILGKVLESVDISDPNLSLILMSDHGFSSFNRQFHLNRWLEEKGYLKRRRKKESRDYFSSVDWSKTAAYNVGINSLYLNLQGRERDGALSANEAQKVRKKLASDLLEVRDRSGEKVITGVRVTPNSELAQHPNAPDMILGFNEGYRNSWQSIMGGFSDHIMEDNEDKWSGDHCINPLHVPAVFASNRKAHLKNPNLCDITATIVGEFDKKAATECDGKPVWS